MMKVWRAEVLAFLTGLLMAGGCSTGATGGAVDAPPPASEPLVAPGDQVQLKIWNEMDMNGTFTVAGTGDVILPKLGAVQVARRAIPELQDSLRAAYADYLRNPSVNVTVLRRVGVQGEVKQPGIYMVDMTMLLPDVLAMAGGVTESASHEHIYVTRGDSRIRYGMGESGRFISAQLRSGDQVLVGQRSFLARNPTAVVSSLIGVVSILLTALKK